jgi:hypothetical protein
MNVYVCMGRRFLCAHDEHVVEYINVITPRGSWLPMVTNGAMRAGSFKRVPIER